jgi:hypothetical protein
MPKQQARPQEPSKKKDLKIQRKKTKSKCGKLVENSASMVISYLFQA